MVAAATAVGCGGGGGGDDHRAYASTIDGVVVRLGQSGEILTDGDMERTEDVALRTGAYRDDVKALLDVLQTVEVPDDARRAHAVLLDAANIMRRSLGPIFRAANDDQLEKLDSLLVRPFPRPAFTARLREALKLYRQAGYESIG
jgi:hypothetical protein